MADGAGNAHETDHDEPDYEGLEKGFDMVLLEIERNDSLDKFRDEYVKMHTAFKKSRENERRLMVKCRDLKGEIVANSAKLAEVMRLSQDDQGSLAALRREIEKAWKLVDVSQEREAHAKETIETLQEQIMELNKLVEEQGAQDGQQYSVQDLLDLKDKLTEELKASKDTTSAIREELNEAVRKQRLEESNRDEAEMSINQLRDQVSEAQHEAQREHLRKVNLEKEITQVRKALEDRKTSLTTADETNKRMMDRCKALEDRIRELESHNERNKEMLESQRMHSSGIQQKYEEQIEEVESLRRDINDQSALIKSKDEDLRAAKHELSRLRQLRDSLNGKLQAADKDKAELERQKDDIKAQIGGLEKDLDQERRHGDQKRKKCDELVRDRDKLDRQMRMQVSATEKQSDLVKMHLQGQRNLEAELANYQAEVARQKKLISSLERERDSYYQEIGEKLTSCEKLNEMLKVREIQIIDFKKQIADADAKRKQQQNLYEAVRSDRNMFSKTLQEKQDELKEIQRRLGTSLRTVEQLKDDLATKDTALVKEHAEHQKLEKDKESLRSELTRLKEEVKEAGRYADEQLKEHQKLQRLIQESDAERARQRKELDHVLSERDVLGTQLIRRNDELVLLHEKLKVQDAIMDRGDFQYQQLLADIRLLRIAVKQARSDRAAMGKTVANFTELKQEVFRTQRLLVREKTRCKALELEIQNPLNVHRWRKLKGTDPSKFELINKVQALQRKLISKTEEVVERELLIKDKEKLYVELKQILARQPGPEVEQQIVMYQQTLKSKTKQLKAMTAELNMLEAQMSEAKMEGERLGRELQDVKKKYFTMKKKDQQKRERDTVMGSGGLPPIRNPADAPTSRFTGGGFNLRTSRSRIVQ